MRDALQCKLFNSLLRAEQVTADRPGEDSQRMGAGSSLEDQPLVCECKRKAKPKDMTAVLEDQPLVCECKRKAQPKDMTAVLEDQPLVSEYKRKAQ